MISTEIAVVGGGPAGLAAVLALAGTGRDVLLIAPAAPPDLRTSALLGGSVGLLGRLGVWEHLREKAAPLRHLRIIDGTRRLLRAPEVTFTSDEVGLEAFGYNVRNTDLVAALERVAAQRGIARRNALATGAEIGGDRVLLTLSDGGQVEARLVVAADGRRSAMREAAGIAVRSWHYEQAALVANLRHGLPHHDTSTEFHTEYGPFTLVPLGDRQSSLVWVGKPEEHARRMALADDRLAAEIEDRAQSILSAMVLDGPRQLFPLSGMTARRFADKRIALVGEAGHVVPPIGAQGLNLGLRDGAELADLVATAPDPGDIVAAFDRKRQFDIVSRTAAIDALNRSVLTGFLPAQLARGVGLFLLDRVPLLRRAAMRQGLGGA